jgi:DNA-binding MarR family transcriptional regulator
MYPLKGQKVDRLSKKTYTQKTHNQYTRRGEHASALKEHQDYNKRIICMMTFFFVVVT